MKTILSFILIIFSLSSYSQKISDWWKAKNSHKMKYYYWDSFKSFPENHPDNTRKEFVYHVTVTNDSTLEREMTYNDKNLLIEIKKFGVPSKGELIETDSLFYNSFGQIETEKQFSQGYYGNIDTTIITYTYDSLNREISKISTERFLPNTWLTSYEVINSGQKIKRVKEFLHDIEYSEEVHFFSNSGIVDSIQIFNNGKWFQTTEIVYDSTSHTQNKYFRYSNYRALRSKIVLNEQGTTVYVLVNEFKNWNETKFYNVEIKKQLTKEGYIQTCDYFIDGKKRYSKVHLYTSMN